MMLYLTLFWEFFKTGLFAVGGGLATIPFVNRMSAAYGWISPAEIADMIAVAESTPGPIGINLATYTGFKVAGILGSLCATTAIVLPSLILMSLLARMLEKYKENKIVQAVFSGLRPAATGLIAAAAYGVIKLALYNAGHSAIWDLIKWPELLLFIAIFALIRLLKQHPVLYIALAGCVGVLFRL